MAEATHVCGDPGIQYDTTINRWNPVKASGRIHSSNPCSEYMFLDDTACNLASLNLMRFVGRRTARFDVEAFRRAVALTILAQEIIVDHADYPTPQIARNSHLFRPLGLGYANLGALLMASGLPYDSDEGRNLAAAITSLMCGQAYLHQRRDRRGDGAVRALPDESRVLPRGDRDAQGGGGGGAAARACRPICTTPRARAGRRRSTAGGGTASRTRRSRCSRRPARSPS